MTHIQPAVIDLEQWKNEGYYFEYSRGDYRHRIFYRDSTEISKADIAKPVLLLIHGFPTASIDWYAVWPEFNKYFRLITLDMIGFGLSDKPKNYEYSIHDQADVYQAFLNHLGISNYHILAHDYGDTVTQELLARQLEQAESTGGDNKILTALLLNGGLFPETHRPVLMQKLLASPFWSLLIKYYSFVKFKKTFDYICIKPISEKELNIYWQLLQHNNGVAAIPKLIRYMEERRAFRARWVGALENNSLPLGLIDGLDDPISGAHMVARYQQLIDGADITGLEGVGHYPQIEAPQQVSSAALEFWKKHNII